MDTNNYDIYFKGLSLPRHVIYFDKDKKIRLLIRYNTIQAWCDEKLEFIHIVNDNPVEPEAPYEKFKIIKIKYGVNKFDLLISKEEGKDIQIKIELDDDIIYIVRSAIDALIYLDSKSKSANLAVRGKRIAYNYITNENESTDGSEKCISQILSVISISDNESNTEHNIKTKFKKIKNIISRRSLSDKSTKKRPLHSWQVSLEEILPDDETNIDTTILTFFLEYYSNNAMDNIGWMNAVSEIISLLYEKNLDLSSFKLHEIKKNSKNSLKVYIPITQLIPRDTKLGLKYISDDEIPYIRMVPFIDFAINKKTLDPMDYFQKAITKFLLPGKYSSFETKNYSPFIRLLINMDVDDTFYDNPSMEAVMNWVWYSTKSHWNYALQIYLIYLLSYSIISWAYISHIEVQQFMFYGKKYVVDYFNWMDNIATFLPTILSSYFFLAAKEKSRRVVFQLQTNLIRDYAMLEGSYTTSKTSAFDYKFKYNLNVKYICFLDEPSLTKTWNEKSHESSARRFDIYNVVFKQVMELNIDTDEVGLFGLGQNPKVTNRELPL
ncbi:206_t:CDS:2, partial [Cetraspora pellucida]